ncbi:hypothetical protein [Streptomyces sp. NPDC091383]|uniref:hypothetical protein n=1 Tax=Streptomyces sp. NPDC091383 TaxID=3365996 RepID=UPI003815153A
MTDRATLKNAPRDSEDWDDDIWAAWWRTAERVHGDTASPTAVEAHIVADDSDDPEHTDDCPGCETQPRPTA